MSAQGGFDAITAGTALAHMKVLASRQDFEAARTPMAFNDQDAACVHVVAHADEPRLKGRRAEIIEDLGS